MDTIASLFSFITTPVSWVIVQFHKVYGALFGDDSGWAWGLSIVSLVVLIRICLIPLFVKQIKSTRNMQVLQPKMKAIQERYKNDKQRQSEEMMKLYKETGTNPLSSCLPILAQSPFFFALYHVLSSIASGKKIGAINQELLDSARQAHIFGAPLAAKFTDNVDKLTSLDATLLDVRVVTAVMIVLMSASQFFTQRQLMTKNVDLTVKTPYMQQQKMLMYIFPVIFAVMGVNFPVGVLVYWLTTNVWTMGQQMYVINQNPTPGSKAQDAYLQRVLKTVDSRGQVRGRTQRRTVKAIVAKGPDRNDIERKFITGLSKKGLAAQEDGTVQKSETAVIEAEGGAAPKRQQPKRQTKAKRQTAATASGAAKDEPEAGSKTSLEKRDASQDDKPTSAGKPASGSSRQAKSGQRKGPQRPKHPSKK
ncbi:membrane protein insertase YidC [Streptomyces microflavus]|uniref:Membrane protein insertase YidC n=1 Tax=Streptomyces microflavus DSM 40593 TaxID=1303692 RepID=N0CUD5_STRMI|nr:MULTISPECIES: membrane protein insertase YidC [Streptomyces]AGK78489.1 Membrane protein oxaA [Streptomyces microflavus DSM 40593]MCX4653658.1 membrane protein insertase YidC [Streptomyces microflavus]WSA61880.1 membrane protein insertase YidC [Streptomyces microflavus]SCK31147.1 YidC/Oxa1 family membrane protein insertase [Streptomyces sp. ScaeMP-e48]